MIASFGMKSKFAGGVVLPNSANDTPNSRDGQPESSGSGKAEPLCRARTTDKPYSRKFPPFFRQVPITLFKMANASAPQSLRLTPPSLRAATTLRMSRSARLLSAGTSASTRKVSNSNRCRTSRLLIRRQSGCFGFCQIISSSRDSILRQAAWYFRSRIVSRLFDNAIASVNNAINGSTYFLA